MEASWQPDPTGRHQYRWWDGVGWTDFVADDGAESVDPLRRVGASSGPTVTVSTTPTLGPVNPTPPAGYATEPIVPGRGPGRLVVAAAVALALAGAVVYLLVNRGGSNSESTQTGMTVGQLTGEGSYVARDVRLRAGEAIRFRVEGPEDRDLVTYLIASEAVANAYADAYFTDFGTDLGLSDLDQVISDWTDADDVLTDGTMEDDMVGYVVMKRADRCCAGVPDADWFVAVAAGTYRIVVVEAEGRDAEVRIFVEEYRRRIGDYSDMSDVAESDPFFTDTAFFKDTEEYEPDVGP